MKQLITILIVAVSHSLFSQGTGEIRGVVMDKEFNQPIVGANVWVEYGGNKIGTSTDLDGKFIIKPLTSGTYTIKYSFVGKKQHHLTGVTVKSDKIYFSDSIYLENNMLDGITIVCERPKIKLIDPEEPSKITLDSKEITAISSARSPGTLISIASGGAVKTSADGEQVYFRGSRAGTMITFLDGVKIMDGNVPSVPLAAMKSYTVYTGGMPAKYGDTMGGVVVIETKSYFDLYNEHQAKQTWYKK